MTTASDTTAAVSAFVEAFQRFWDDPSTGGLPEILHHDAVLRQPLSPPMNGMAAVQEEFGRIFTFLPDRA